MFHFTQELGFFHIPEDYGILLGNYFNTSKASHCTVVKARLLLYFILATKSFTENEYIVTRLLSFYGKSEELSVSNCLK